MALDKQHSDDTQFEPLGSTSSGVPGKKPVTAGLSGRPQFVFRVESPEAAMALAGAFGARNSNGVAAGADLAVDRAASSSSGQPLPEDLRGRFESSLGADLGGVRLHTGGASAEAAGAVGARAYTTGNDIHFGAGNFDPSSAFGVHLIAHEVAHTVQQQGASSPARQHKLEVSTPGDSAEVEADRAADAMVAGRSAGVTSGGGVARTIHRDAVPPGPDETGYTMNRDAGDVAVIIKKDELEQVGDVNTGNAAPYLGANNIEDRGQAIDMFNRISGYMPTVGESGDTEKLNSNLSARAALQAYLAASADQNRAQCLFGPEYVQVVLEQTRLDAMVRAHFAQAGAIYPGSNDGTALAKQLMVSGTGRDKDEAVGLAGAMQNQGVSTDPKRSADLTTCKDNIKTLQDRLTGFGPAITDAVQHLLAQSKAMNAAIGLASLPPAIRASTAQQQAAANEVAGVKNDLAAAVAVTGAVLAVARKGVETIPEGKIVTDSAESIGEVVTAGAQIDAAAHPEGGGEIRKVELTEDIVKYLSDYDAKMKLAENKVAALADEEARRAAEAAVKAVRAAEVVFKASVATYQRNQLELVKVRARLRKEVDALNKLVPSNTPGRSNLGAMVGLQSEAAVFVTRCDVALGIGEQEREEARAAKAAKETAAPADYKNLDPDKHFGEVIAEKEGLTYYEAHKYRDRHNFLGDDPYYFKFERHEIRFTKTPTTKTGTQEAMDESMDAKLTKIREMRTEMSLLVSQMRLMTGI